MDLLLYILSFRFGFISHISLAKNVQPIFLFHIRLFGCCFSHLENISFISFIHSPTLDESLVCREKDFVNLWPCFISFVHRIAIISTVIYSGFIYEFPILVVIWFIWTISHRASSFRPWRSPGKVALDRMTSVYGCSFRMDFDGTTTYLLAPGLVDSEPQSDDWTATVSQLTSGYGCKGTTNRGRCWWMNSRWSVERWDYRGVQSILHRMVVGVYLCVDCLVRHFHYWKAVRSMWKHSFFLMQW